MSDSDETRRQRTGPSTVRLKVRRQDRPDAPETRRWEQFDVPLEPGLTVTGALSAIDRNPVTTSGATVAPIAWEAGCLSDACGACALLVDGSPRQGCTTRLDAVARKNKPVVLEPLSKFPIVRDLIVDRSRLFEDDKRVTGWITIGPGLTRRDPAAISPARQQTLEAQSRCTACGACLEACPQYGEHSSFVGAAALNRARRLNLDPTGRHQRVERLESVMGPGGVADCGKAQNCVEVCPVGVPLVDSIQSLSRDTSRHLLLGWLLG